MDREILRQVLGKIPYGILILGSKTESGVSAMVATWVTQVSFKPPLLAAAIEADSTMRRLVEKSGYFSVNLLPSGGKGVAKSFLKSQPSNGTSVSGHQYRAARHGSPFLSEAAASLECRVTEFHTTGDHILFVGEVVEAEVRRDEEVLTLKETGWKYQK
jgi:flavin reductase (DIM6/NTAB) family NADH-FMN oxidoreductase RutF